MKKIALITLLFLVAGATINAHAADLRQIDRDLIAAVKAGDPALVTAAIAHGAHVDTIDPSSHFFQYSALMIACQKESAGIVNILLDNGAKPDTESRSIGGLWQNTLVTPLMLASRKGNTEIIEALIKHGANINAVCRLGESALVFAALWGHVRAVKCLVEHGANIKIGYHARLDDPTVKESALVVAQCTSSEANKEIARPFQEIALYLEEVASRSVRRSTLLALLASEEFYPREDGCGAFPPELVDRVLRPLVIASLEEQDPQLR